MTAYQGPRETDLTPDATIVERFLASWFADAGDGEIDIGYTDPASGSLNKFQRFGVGQIQTAAAFVANVNRYAGHSVYFRPAVIDPHAPRNVTDKNFLRSPGAWCDLDADGAVKTAKTKYGTMKPSFVVITGRHPHTRAQLFFKATEPVLEADTLKTLNRAICADLGGDSKVINPTTLMRVPGTIAWPYKHGRTVELTELVLPDDKPRLYGLSALRAKWPPEKANAPLLQQPAHDVPPPNGPARPVEAAGKPSGLVINMPGREAEILASFVPGNMHNALVRLVAHWVAIGLPSSAIRMAVLAHTVDAKQRHGEPYDRSEIAERIEDALGSARTKFNVPEPAAVEVEYDAETGEISKAPAGKPPLPMVWLKDVRPQTDVADFVEGLLIESSMFVIYGESNSGKTFFATDLGLSVAAGRKWRGEREVEKGVVVYCALEGRHGISNRIAAWKHDTGLGDDTDIPFAVIPVGIDMLDPQADTQRLIDAIQDAASKYTTETVDQETGEVIEAPMPVRLVIIDTLSRAMAGGNENASEDMGALVKNTDRVREATGACTGYVHHSGKDQARGARGHSLLRAATDTEIEVSRDEVTGLSVARVTKQREMPVEGEFNYRLKVVELGIDRRGNRVTSCVVEPVGRDEANGQRSESNDNGPKVKLSPQEERALELLAEVVGSPRGFDQPATENTPRVRAAYYAAWKDELVRRGIVEGGTADSQRAQASKLRAKLASKKVIGCWGDVIWITGLVQPGETETETTENGGFAGPKPSETRAKPERNHDPENRNRRNHDRGETPVGGPPSGFGGFDASPSEDDECPF